MYGVIKQDFLTHEATALQEDILSSLWRGVEEKLEMSFIRAWQINLYFGSGSFQCAQWFLNWPVLKE